jgi:two-component system response regulator HydG
MDTDRLPDALGLLNALPEPRVLIGPDYRVAAVNDAYWRQFGGEETIEGRFCYEVSHRYATPCDQAGEYCPLRDCMETGEPHRVLHVHYTAAGQEHVEVEVAPVPGSAFFMETMRTLRHARSDTRERELVGYSRPFNRMLELAKRVAERETSVLLLGESGTGKELMAQAIHDMSPRADAPFVVVECSGLTESLFESELFGYEKGAFTGAISRKIGLVEAVQGGTLFLDEVGDIPLGLQVKLLRLLEAGTYRRVGGLEPLRADFRLIAATHRDLGEMVRQGSFRQDLFFRINVFAIRLPPLRERAEDIPLLAERLLARLEPGRKVSLSAETLETLARHDFPGNVRELRNILEHALILADGSVIQPQHLPGGMGSVPRQAIPAVTPLGDLVPLESLEKHYLRWAVQNFRGDRKSLAERLQVSERTLYRKLREL